MFTNSSVILEQLKNQITASVINLLPTASIALDEPLDLVYDNLPEVCIYPMTEQFVYEESFSQDKKLLNLSIEIRMKSSPASSVCTPVVNAICDAIKADLHLAGLADYVELQTIQWANDKTTEGQVCGAAISVAVSYLI